MGVYYNKCKEIEHIKAKEAGIAVRVPATTTVEGKGD